MCDRPPADEGCGPVLRDHMSLCSGYARLCPPGSVDSDSESGTSVSGTSVSGTSVSESFYCMYDDQEETDQSESTDGVDDE